MSKRYAALYSDGSFNVSSDGCDLIEAQKRIAYNTSDEDTKLVEVEIKVTKIIHETNPSFQSVTESSVQCPCCGTEVFIEKESKDERQPDD